VAKRCVIVVGDGTVEYGDDEFLWLSVVNMSLSLQRFGRSFECIVAAITHVHQITVSFPSVDCSIQYSSVVKACIVGLQSLWI